MIYPLIGVALFLPQIALAMIGGDLITSETAPGAVFFSELRCSGVKIGSRLYMTAAHCVIVITKDNQSYKLEPGNPLNIGVQAGAQQKSNKNTIIKVYPHPSWDRSVKGFKLPTTPSYTDAESDIALIEVKEENDIAIARVSFIPVDGAGSKQIRVVGYGGQEPGYSPTFPNPGKRAQKAPGARFANQVTYDASEPNSDRISETVGGDSGGPVYVTSKQGLQEVVGVNSSSSLGLATMRKQGGQSARPQDAFYSFSRLDPLTGSGNTAEWIRAVMEKTEPDPIPLLEVEACSGLDLSGPQPWQMVPLGGKKIIQIPVSEPLVILTEGVKAQLTPAPSGKGQWLTIFADKSVDWGAVKLCLARDVKKCKTIYVSVKPRLSRKLLLRPTSSGTSPDPSAVKKYLNHVFGDQANVFFDEVVSLSQSTDYDLNKNGVLDIPLLGNEEGPELALLLASETKEWDGQIFYISKISRGTAFRNGKTLVISDHHRNSTENSTAHEVGHLLGIPGNLHNPSADHLMYASDLKENPCKLNKSEWDLINPTAASKAPLSVKGEADANNSGSLEAQ